MYPAAAETERRSLFVAFKLSINNALFYWLYPCFIPRSDVYIRKEKARVFSQEKARVFSLRKTHGLLGHVLHFNFVEDSVLLPHILEHRFLQFYRFLQWYWSLVNESSCRFLHTCRHGGHCLFRCYRQRITGLQAAGLLCNRCA